MVEQSKDNRPVWLSNSLRDIAKKMRISTLATFEESLRTFPYAENWNGKMLKQVYAFVEHDREQTLPRTRELHSTATRSISAPGCAGAFELR